MGVVCDAAGIPIGAAMACCIAVATDLLYRAMLCAYRVQQVVLKDRKASWGVSGCRLRHDFELDPTR